MHLSTLVMLSLHSFHDLMRVIKSGAQKKMDCYQKRPQKARAINLPPGCLSSG